MRCAARLTRLTTYRSARPAPIVLPLSYLCRPWRALRAPRAETAVGVAVLCMPARSTCMVLQSGHDKVPRSWGRGVQASHARHTRSGMQAGGGLRAHEGGVAAGAHALQDARAAHEVVQRQEAQHDARHLRHRAHAADRAGPARGGRRVGRARA